MRQILQVQTALTGFESGELRRRDAHAPRHLGLPPACRFAKQSENPAVHDESGLHESCQSGNDDRTCCQIGNGAYSECVTSIHA
jgi:hypothetical protein